jgi:hypothetical protein
MNRTAKNSPTLEESVAGASAQVGRAITCLGTQLDLEGSAQYSGALQRRRAIQTAQHLLQYILLYALSDFSLSLLGAWGTMLGWGSLNKNAVRKRLRNSVAWLGRLVVLLLLRGQLELPHHAGTRIRLIDASLITLVGNPKASFRLHLSFDLSAGRVDGVALTSLHEGESLTRWSFAANEICLADRYYGVPRGIGHLLGAGAQFVVRVGWRNLPLQDQDGQPFSPIAWLRAIASDPAAAPAEARVWVCVPHGRFPIRLVARAMPCAKAELKRKAMRAEAHKKQRQVDERSLLAAGFVMVVSNLPPTWSAAQILALYRFRWQVELVFKRLKSLLTLDQLRLTQDPALAQVVLLAKILVALLLGETQWRLALLHSEGFSDPHRPLSLWRLTQLLLHFFRAAFLGTPSWQALAAAWPRLSRYLCDPPRRRPSQFAQRPDLHAVYGADW